MVIADPIHEAWCVYYWCEDEECGHARAKKPLPPRKLTPVEEAVQHGRGYRGDPPVLMRRY